MIAPPKQCGSATAANIFPLIRCGKPKACYCRYWGYVSVRSSSHVPGDSLHQQRLYVDCSWSECYLCDIFLKRPCKPPLFDAVLPAFQFFVGRLPWALRVIAQSHHPAWDEHE